jgi:hypothetical protein
VPAARLVIQKKCSGNMVRAQDWWVVTDELESSEDAVPSVEVASSLVVVSPLEVALESSVDVEVEVESSVVVEPVVVEVTAACRLADEELVVPIEPS